jgi:hypothetical protein
MSEQNRYRMNVPILVVTAQCRFDNVNRAARMQHKRKQNQELVAAINTQSGQSSAAIPQQSNPERGSPRLKEAADYSDLQVLFHKK